MDFRIFKARKSYMIRSSGTILEVLQYEALPLAKVEQALYTSPRYKYQFNIEVPHWGTYQILG